MVDLATQVSRSPITADRFYVSPNEYLSHSTLFDVMVFWMQILQ
jgi:hypothetical protein